MRLGIGFALAIEVEESEIHEHPAAWPEPVVVENAPQAVASELRGEYFSAGTVFELSKSLHRVRNGESELSPIELFGMQCHLLNWLADLKDLSSLYPSFGEWIGRSWRRIIDDQRFALVRPMSTVPELEAALASKRDNTLSYAARVLLMANGTVGSPLSHQFRKLIEELGEGRR